MAPTRSVPAVTRPFGLNRQLRRWLAGEPREPRPVIEASAAAGGAEHSRQHCTSYRHLCLLLFHGLSSHSSLRQSYEPCAAGRGLVAASGLGRHAPCGPPGRRGQPPVRAAGAGGPRRAAHGRSAARVAGHPGLDLTGCESAPGPRVAAAPTPGRLGRARPGLAPAAPGSARGGAGDLDRGQRLPVLGSDHPGGPRPTGGAPRSSSLASLPPFSISTPPSTPTALHPPLNSPYRASISRPTRLPGFFDLPSHRIQDGIAWSVAPTCPVATGRQRRPRPLPSAAPSGGWTRRRARGVWTFFKSTPEPLGYDPAGIGVPGWDSPTSPSFVVPRLAPWRVRVFPSSITRGEGGELLTWQA